MIEILDKQFEDYISSEELGTIVKRILNQIKNDYDDFSNLIVVGVLNGAIPFLNDIYFGLPSEVAVDYIKTSSYGNATRSTGKIRLLLDNQLELTDKDVLIVEDIVDSGLTQKFLCEHFLAKGVKSVKICSLLYKSVNSQTGITPDYYGLDIPDYFVVGYGMDYAQYGRNLNKIVKIIEE